MTSDDRTFEKLSLDMQADSEAIIAERKSHAANLWKEENIGKRATLQDVHAVFQKWMHLKDTKVIDICLAVALSNKMPGTPLWVFHIGPSGDGKSEIVMSLEDPDRTYIMHEMTANTLVSGFTGNKKEEENFDLAPELDNKVMIIPDMAAILNLMPADKAKVWAQFRELYDGRAGRRTGCTKKKSYEGLHVSMLACSTPSIDDQILVFSHLGTRELLYRTNIDGETETNKLMAKVLENEEHEEEMRAELKDVMNRFVAWHEPRRMEIPAEDIEKLKGMMEYLRYMRATANTDSYSGELVSIVYPEQPTRALKQLKRLYLCLRSLDESYDGQRALDVVAAVVRSSILPMREQLMRLLAGTDATDANGNPIDLSTSKIAELLRIGKKQAFRNLNILWNMKLIERRTDELDNRMPEYWSINKEGRRIMSWLKL